jgi:hypothetical protein
MNAMIILAIGLLCSGVAGLIHISVTKKLVQKLNSVSKDLDTVDWQLKIISGALTKIQRYTVADKKVSSAEYGPMDPDLLKRIDEQIAKSAERQKQNAEKDLKPHEQRRAADTKPRTLGERMREANLVNFPPKK